MGHKRLKSLLYFPAMVAGTYNPLVKALWVRLKAQNKPGKVIVEACMHKLLAIAYGVLRSGKPFDLDTGAPFLLDIQNGVFMSLSRTLTRAAPALREAGTPQLRSRAQERRGALREQGRGVLRCDRASLD
jgi:hypothetical protein